MIAFSQARGGHRLAARFICTAGGTKSLALTSHCGMQPPLTGNITINASAAGVSQTLTVPVTLNRGP